MLIGPVVSNRGETATLRLPAGAVATPELPSKMDADTDVKREPSYLVAYAAKGHGETARLGNASSRVT
jgi:hypothetical protein